jgi:hypothetical protein
MTRSQIFLVATLTFAIVCAATWLAMASEPGTVPDVVDAAISRPTEMARPQPDTLPVASPASAQ